MCVRTLVQCHYMYQCNILKTRGGINIVVYIYKNKKEIKIGNKHEKKKRINKHIFLCFNNFFGYLLYVGLFFLLLYCTLHYNNRNSNIASFFFILYIINLILALLNDKCKIYVS